MTRLSICPGCGYAHPTEPGATHAYVVTSPECWQRFGAISTTIRERLFTDAYMAQHPGGVDKRQTQSVAVHLVTLNAVLSHGQPPSQASQITRAAVDLGRLHHGYKRLPEPASWDLTIGDVDEGGTEASTYVVSVLEVWMNTQAKTIEEWTLRTLQSLYGN